MQTLCVEIANSTDRNVEIVISDVMTEVRTPVPTLCVYVNFL
jgi:hypothetical protein